MDLNALTQLLMVPEAFPQLGILLCVNQKIQTANFSKSD
jgi:hypothetical protein